MTDEGITLTLSFVPEEARVVVAHRTPAVCPQCKGLWDGVGEVHAPHFNASMVLVDCKEREVRR